MKLSSVEALPVQIPIGGHVAAVSAAVVRLRTEDGAEGLGHAIPFSPQQFRSLVAAIEELGELLIGQDPTRPERVHRTLLPSGWGLGGVGNVATAAFDIAVWDLAAKSAGLPLYRLLGGYRNRVPAYASLRLRITLSIAELQDVAASLVAQGFRAVKMNVGGQPTVAGEVARVRAVREAIGPDVGLLADANSRWTPSRAIRVGRALAEFDLFWLEDPVPAHNVEGHAEVRRALDIPIATGEALFSLPAFRPLFEARAVDFPMPDLLRVGGITPFVKLAHLAEAYGLPFANHLSPEISSQVVAAVPNGHIVEFNPWAWQLFQGCPTLDHGELVMSEEPGHGLTLDADFAERHALR